MSNTAGESTLIVTATNETLLNFKRTENTHFEIDIGCLCLTNKFAVSITISLCQPIEKSIIHQWWTQWMSIFEFHLYICILYSNDDDFFQFIYYDFATYVRQTTMLIFIWTLKKRRYDSFFFTFYFSFKSFGCGNGRFESTKMTKKNERETAHDWLLIVDCERNHLIM